MNKPVHIGNIYGPDRGTGYAGNIWGIEGISPTLTTMGGGMREPMILLYEAHGDTDQAEE